MVAGSDVFDFWRDRRESGRNVRFLPSDVVIHAGNGEDQELQEAAAVYQVRVSFVSRGGVELIGIEL
jgi:hypothetical protein